MLTTGGVVRSTCKWSGTIVLGAAVLWQIAAAAQQQQTDKNWQAHLDQAKALLDTVPQKTKPDEAVKQIDSLRDDFAEMMKAYQSPTTDSHGQPVDWKLKFSDVERDLVRLIGAGMSST